MISSTYLLHSDERVNLKDYALDFSNKIFKDLNLNIFSEDIVYYENIKIDNVRDIISNASKSSYSGIKVFILNLENIRNEAINALLKIIEEPPKDTYFLLLIKKVDYLPKTIVSRSINMYIRPKRIECSEDIYQLFDGNEGYIKEFLSSDIQDISIYKISDNNEVSINIKEYFDDRTNLVSKIKYELAIRYIVFNLKFENVINKLDVIQDICDIILDRAYAKEFLNRILIVASQNIQINKLIYLTNLKNSLKNNVSIKHCIYIFLNELIGG